MALPSGLYRPCCPGSQFPAQWITLATVGSHKPKSCFATHVARSNSAAFTAGLTPPTQMLHSFAAFWGSRCHAAAPDAPGAAVPQREKKRG